MRGILCMFGGELTRTWRGEETSSLGRALMILICPARIGGESSAPCRGAGTIDESVRHHSHAMENADKIDENSLTNTGLPGFSHSLTVITRYARKEPSASVFSFRMRLASENPAAGPKKNPRRREWTSGRCGLHSRPMYPHIRLLTASNDGCAFQTKSEARTPLDVCCCIGSFAAISLQFSLFEGRART